MDHHMPEAGGFLQTSLPSPAPSNVSFTSTRSALPHPRSKPIKPGSAKEDATRQFLEERLLNIQRRYTKKFQPADEDSTEGYKNMKEACEDFAELIDVLWLSGTPTLQIPYLLNIAGLLGGYLSAFPPAPISTFRLLRKLDYAFASLLKGVDVSTGTSLPGFESGKRMGMSKTDMVRCKGLVENTRVEIVEVMNQETEMEDERSPEDVNLRDTESAAEDDDDIQMDIARVYEETIVLLGELLDNSTHLGTTLQAS